MSELDANDTAAAPQFTNALRENTAEIRVQVPEVLKQGLQNLAHLKQVGLEDYLRDVLIAHVYGEIALAAHSCIQKSCG